LAHSTGIVVVELRPAQGVVVLAANGEMLGIILVTGKQSWQLTRAPGISVTSHIL